MTILNFRAQTQNERLQKMCVAYRLKPKEKRRKYYEQALEAFSLNQDAWESWRWATALSLLETEADQRWV